MRFPVDRFRNEPTPFYFYDIELLERTLRCIDPWVRHEGFCVHYAIKANANPAVLRHIVAHGLGVDCVSGGEISAAIDAGFRHDGIVYAGVGKSDREIRLALEVGIGAFNVESEAELEVIAEIAQAMGKTAKVALRVNPNIDAHTHEYITTGLSENKFGIDMSHLRHVISRALELPPIEFVGLHFHIGSQIMILDPFVLLCERINELVDKLAKEGIRVASVNVGGGLGVDYDTPDAHPIADFNAYFGVFKRHLHLPNDTTVHFELGRAIVAQCGSLISRVLYVKQGVAKRFAIIDAGMTDLIRPALYGAHHKVENLTSPSTEMFLYDVVGPVCESSDVFEKNASLPLTRRGDLIAIRTAGAYGEVMSMHYNLRPTPPSVVL